jgi:hypothetical protein
LQHLFPPFTLTIRRMCLHDPMAENKMREIAAAVLMVGGLAVAGQASAHDGAAVVGALLGGAVIGAVVGSALNPAPPVVYQAPAYAPVYQAPAYAPVYQQAPVPVYAGYQQPPVYAGPPGYCYDQYRGGYVACGPAPVGQYGYAPPPPPPGW